MTKQTDKNEKHIFPMIKKYYSCFDKTGECYIGCFESETDMRAIRMMEDAVNNPQTGMYKHPEDYRLDKLYELNARTGEIVENTIKKIIEIKELKDNGKN